MAMNSTEKTNKEDEAKVRSWTAYVFILLATICSALSNFGMKLSGPNEKALFVLIRCGMQYLILYPYIAFTKKEILESRAATSILLFTRGLSGSVGMFSLAFSLNYLSLGDAIAIFYTFPVLVGIFAFIFLKGELVYSKNVSLKKFSVSISLGRQGHLRACHVVFFL